MALCWAAGAVWMAHMGLYEERRTVAALAAFGSAVCGMTAYDYVVKGE